MGQLFHGEFRSALELNALSPLVVIVLLVLVWRPTLPPWLWKGLAGMMLVYGAWRIVV